MTELINVIDDTYYNIVVTVTDITDNSSLKLAGNIMFHLSSLGHYINKLENKTKQKIQVCCFVVRYEFSQLASHPKYN